LTSSGGKMKEATARGPESHRVAPGERLIRISNEPDCFEPGWTLLFREKGRSWQFDMEKHILGQLLFIFIFCHLKKINSVKFLKFSCQNYKL